MSLSLVVGLGNPGASYERTRHNVGWRVVDALAADRKATWREERSFRGLLARVDGPKGRPLILLKPTTYMNECGQSVRSVCDYFKINIDSVVIVYDELSLSLGKMKVSLSGSAGGHNGVISLLACLGDGFSRLRIGIGPKFPKEMDLADFVLSPFQPEEEVRFTGFLPHCVAAVNCLLELGPVQAMTRLNQRTLSS